MRKNTFTFLRTLFLTITLPVISITFVSCEQDDESETQNHPKAVDLGLSVKWASCNVGAKSPKDYGDYYAWGETETKSNYDGGTYKLFWDDIDGDGYGEFVNIDNNISGTSYDVASVKWGDGWRMPTYDEFKELLEKCSWTFTYYEGYKVTGPNGNSIFLPLPGCRYGSETINRSWDGHYWSGSLTDSDDGEYAAFYLYINSAYNEPCAFISYSSGPHGKSIRPVKR